MKKTFRFDIDLKKDGYFSEELNRMITQIIFSKISLLENYYLRGVTCYQYSDLHSD